MNPFNISLLSLFLLAGADLLPPEENSPVGGARGGGIGAPPPPPGGGGGGGTGIEGDGSGKWGVLVS